MLAGRKRQILTVEGEKESESENETLTSLIWAELSSVLTSLKQASIYPYMAYLQ